MVSSPREAADSRSVCSWRNAHKASENCVDVKPFNHQPVSSYAKIPRRRSAEPRFFCMKQRYHPLRHYPPAASATAAYKRPIGRTRIDRIYTWTPAQPTCAEKCAPTLIARSYAMYLFRSGSSGLSYSRTQPSRFFMLSRESHLPKTYRTKTIKRLHIPYSPRSTASFAVAV